MPGPISSDTEQLIDNILNHDPKEYEERFEKFRGKYNIWDDGRASEKVVKLIEELIG